VQSIGGNLPIAQRRIKVQGMASSAVPERYPSILFCPDCRIAFASFDRYVGACSGAHPPPLVTLPVCRALPADDGHAVPSGQQWAYEIKHDGYRFICRRDGDRVRVFSRCGYD
jgi:hypothetical protein